MNVDQAWKIAQENWDFRDPASPPGRNVLDDPKPVPFDFSETLEVPARENDIRVFRFQRRATTWLGQPAIEITEAGTPTFRKVYAL